MRPVLSKTDDIVKITTAIGTMNGKLHSGRHDPVQAAGGQEGCQADRAV